TAIGIYIDDEIFRMIMAIIIIISVGIMIWLERGHKEEVPTNAWFGAASGVIGGFSSMIGNLAGAVMALYLLSMRLPKNAFIGTAAWFFMVMNWFKVPFHVFVWDTINLNTVLFDLTTLPAIFLGGYLGIVIVRKIPERSYRWFIIIMTLAAAVVMLV
ncbi:MAG: sulfite exporter TauE/SafE family protein, partial [Cyclobacteriaceae bacterium]